MGILSALGLAPSPAVELAASFTQPLSPFAPADNHLERVAFAGLLADTVDYVHMDRARAMQLSVIASGRRRIAGTIGRLPLIVTRSGEQLATPQLLEQPEHGRTRSATITWTVDALIFYPYVHWLVTERDAAGWPSRVQLVPKQLEVLNDLGELVAVGDTPVNPINAIRFDAPDSGLLIDAADALRRAWIIAQAASKAEANPVPALDLHNSGEDLTQTEVDQLLDSWEQARRRRGVGYSSRGLEVRTLGVSTEQLLISGRRQLDLELARHLGVPAWAVDVSLEGSSLSYQNRASRNSELIDGALAPYLEAIASRLSLQDVTPRGQRVTFDTDELVKPLREERLKTLGQAVSDGILTIDEARASEGLPPLNDTQEQPANA